MSRVNEPQKPNCCWESHILHKAIPQRVSRGCVKV